MNRREQQLLRPVVTRIRPSVPRLWESLKHQTQFGPEFFEFPYFPAALEIEPVAINAVCALPGADCKVLVAEWKACDRLIHLEEDAGIVRQYGMVALDMLITRARSAGARTSW